MKLRTFDNEDRYANATSVACAGSVLAIVFRQELEITATKANPFTESRLVHMCASYTAIVC
jgi:hypothetical protein